MEYDDGLEYDKQTQNAKLEEQLEGDEPDFQQNIQNKHGTSEYSTISQHPEQEQQSQAPVQAPKQQPLFKKPHGQGIDVSQIEQKPIRSTRIQHGTGKVKVYEGQKKIVLSCKENRFILSVSHSNDFKFPQKVMENFAMLKKQMLDFGIITPALIIPDPDLREKLMSMWINYVYDAVRDKQQQKQFNQWLKTSPPLLNLRMKINEYISDKWRNVTQYFTKTRPFVQKYDLRAFFTWYEFVNRLRTIRNIMVKKLQKNNIILHSVCNHEEELLSCNMENEFWMGMKNQVLCSMQVIVNWRMSMIKEVEDLEQAISKGDRDEKRLKQGLQKLVQKELKQKVNEDMSTLKHKLSEEIHQNSLAKSKLFFKESKNTIPQQP